MSKRVAVAILCLLLFLAACESKTTGRRVALPERSPTGLASSGPTGAVAINTDTGETGKTAAEMLKELQTNPTVIPTSGEKSGTFYPPIVVTGTEREALKQKTRALFTQATYDPNVDADDDFGARYHDSDGDPNNLPDKYSDNSGD